MQKGDGHNDAINVLVPNPDGGEGQLYLQAVGIVVLIRIREQFTVYVVSKCRETL